MKWYYMPPDSHAIENQGHAQHDIRGLLEAYHSTYTTVTVDQMKIFANNARYAMYREGTGSWSDNVGGTGRDFGIKADFLPLAESGPPLFKMMAQSMLNSKSITQGSETCLNAGFILYMKHWMFTHR